MVVITPVVAIKLAFGSIAANPTWTALISPGTDSRTSQTGTFTFIGIKNATDKAMSFSIDGGTTTWFNLDAGDTRTFEDVMIQGAITCRAEVNAADATSGYVRADGSVI